MTEVEELRAQVEQLKAELAEKTRLAAFFEERAEFFVREYTLQHNRAADLETRLRYQVAVK